MITVFDSEGQPHEFEDATKVSTDEHNNLIVSEGRPGAERMTHLFNQAEWRVTEIQYG